MAELDENLKLLEAAVSEWAALGRPRLEDTVAKLSSIEDGRIRDWALRVLRRAASRSLHPISQAERAVDEYCDDRARAKLLKRLADPEPE